MITDGVRPELNRIRKRAHGNCVVCSASNARGLGLDFMPSKDGGVEAIFNCDKAYEGYTGVLHGGIMAALLDGAMTNCMFAHGYVAVTAELNIRFLYPVAADSPVTVRAFIDQSLNPLHVLKAELLQGGTLKATAQGKFMEHPSLEKGLEGFDPHDH